MEICNAIEGNVQYRVYLNAPKWLAEVKNTKTGESKMESWEWAFEPRCGPDCIDINKAESVLDKLIGLVS